MRQTDVLHETTTKFSAEIFIFNNQHDFRYRFLKNNTTAGNKIFTESISSENPVYERNMNIYQKVGLLCFSNIPT